MLLTQVMVCKMISKGHVTFGNKIESVHLCITVHTYIMFGCNSCCGSQVIGVTKKKNRLTDAATDNPKKIMPPAFGCGGIKGVYFESHKWTLNIKL